MPTFNADAKERARNATFEAVKKLLPDAGVVSNLAEEVSVDADEAAGESIEAFVAGMRECQQILSEFITEGFDGESNVDAYAVILGYAEGFAAYHEGMTRSALKELVEEGYVEHIGGDCYQLTPKGIEHNITMGINPQ